MSKSILVLDTPSSCIECPCHYKSDTMMVGKYTYEQLYRCSQEP